MLQITSHKRQSFVVILLTGTVLSTFATKADDFVISTPVTVTNGGNTINNGDSLTVTRSGSISVTGNNVDAVNIQGTTGNVVTNAGTLTVNGTNQTHGIRADTGASILNSGQIIIYEGFAGIRAAGGNTIVNTGSITTFGADTFGLVVNNNNNPTNNGGVTNTGSIRTYGATAAAFFANNNNLLTNSGLVVSAQSNSFELGDSNTLNLNAPSFIGGTIDLGTNTTLNITTGPSHSVLWDLSTGTIVGGAPNFSGPVPVFYNAGTSQVATYDPTAFQAAIDQLADVTGLVSGTIRQRLNSEGGPGGSIATADFGVSAEDAPVPSYLSGPTLWLSALGGYSQYDGTAATLDYDLGQWGLAGGVDWELGGSTRFGLTAGYLETSLEADSPFSTSYDNESNGFFAGLYGRQRFNAHFLDFALTGGGLFHDDERFVNNNLAALGVSEATADYTSWWINPEISVGTDIDTGYGWILTPTARLRYAAQWIESYNETGAGAGNASVDSRNISVGEANLEVAGRKQIGAHTLTGRLGYLYRTSFGDDSTDVTIIGQTVSVPFFDDDRHAGYAGLDANFQLTESASLGIGAQVTVGEDFFGTQGNARLGIKF